MGLQRWPIKDYRGGLNTADGPFSLANNEAQDLLNVTLTERGALKQRAGWTLFSNAAEASVIDHLRNWYPDPGTKHLFASVNGNLVKYDTTGARLLVVSGTAGTIWDMEQNQDENGVRFLWCMNGTDTPRKIATNGTTVTNWTATTGTVPNGKMLRVWKNRFWVAGDAAQPQRLYYSGDATSSPPFINPHVWPTTNFIDIRSTEDDLDPITWIEVLGDHLIVFKRRSVWAVTNPITGDNFRIGPQGCEDRFMTCEFEGRLYFLNRSGLWATRGLPSDLSYESDNIEDFFTGGRIDQDNFIRCRVAATRDRRILIGCPASSGDGHNNRVLEYLPFMRNPQHEGPSRGAWLLHDYRVSALATYRPLDEDIIVSGEVGTKRVARLFNGTNDNGAAIKSHWQSGWKAIFPEEPFERVRRINAEMSGDAVLELFKDFSDTASFSELLIVPVSSDLLWDGGSWDGGEWTPPSPVNLKRARPEVRGRYHSVKFRNEQLNKSFTIYAAEMAIRGGKEH